MPPASLENIGQVAAAWGAAGVGAGGGAMLFKWFLEFIGTRADKREAATVANAARVDAATYKLIEKLEERLNSLTTRLELVEDELIQCRAQHAECEAKLAQLKATVQGLGDARQQVARVVATDRVTDRLVDKIKAKGSEG